VFVLLVAFVAGTVIGLLAWVPTIVRQRREIGRLKRARRSRRRSPRSQRPPPPARARTTSMEFELWWLLALPVFFGMGWVAARVDIKSLLSESRALPVVVLQGLNFLLNEQPDKAIESFLQVPRRTRRRSSCNSRSAASSAGRGEVDRAIRMHQDLCQARGPAAGERREASFELAQDYLQGGPARPRRGGAREDGRGRCLARGPPPPSRHLHPGEGLGEGGRTRAASSR
jgi:hypothetical protein